MRRTGRIALRVLLGALCLLLLAALSGFFVLQSGWFQERVRHRIVREINSATGGRAEIGSFHFEWRRLRVRLGSFVLHGTDGVHEPPLFACRSVDIGLRVVSFLRRDVDIELLALDEPKLHVSVYEDGRTNLPRPKVRGADPLATILALRIGRFAITRGTIEVGAQTAPLDLHGAALDARFSYERHSASYRGQVGFRKLELRAPAAVPVPLDMDAAMSVSTAGIEFTPVAIGVGRSSLRLTGTLAAGGSTRATFEFEGKLHPEDFARPFNLPLRSGQLALTGKGTFSSPSDYSVSAEVTGSGLAFERGSLRVAPVRVASAILLTPGELEMKGLRAGAFGGSFSGRASLDQVSRRFRIEGDATDLEAEQLLQFRGYRRAGWSGRVSGSATLGGVLDGMSVRRAEGSARLDIVAETGGLPVRGAIGLTFDQDLGLVEFAESRLEAGASRIEFDGGLERGIHVNLESHDLNDLLPAIALVRDSPAARLPVALRNGVARFEGTIRGRLPEPRIEGRVSLSYFLFEDRWFDKLTAEVSATADSVRASQIALRRDDALIRGSASVKLNRWALEDSGGLGGSLTIERLAIEDMLPGSPVRGVLSGAVQLAGTLGAPEASCRLAASKPAVGDLHLDRAQVDIRIGPDSVEVSSALLEAGPGRITGKGEFSHPRGDWNNGSARASFSGSRIPLARFRSLIGLPENVEGTVEFDAAGEARVRDSRPQMVSLEGTTLLRQVLLDRKPLGELKVSAKTERGALHLQAGGELAGASVTASSTWRLEEGYPAQGELRFTRMSLSALRPWWSPASHGGESPLEIYAEGKAVFSGRGLDPKAWSASLELPLLEVTPRQSRPAAAAFHLRNHGPVVLRMDRAAVRLESLRLTGKDASLEAAGTVSLEDEKPLQLAIQGSVNLSALNSIEPGLAASGDSRLQATVRGTVTKPLLSGRLEFKDASFYLSNVPNGLDKASGVILLTNNRATIERVTAETGGGKLTLGGFVDFGGKELIYRLQAAAEQVRVRYPEGVSTTANASLNLAGATSRSLLSGTLTIVRSGFTQRVDLASVVGKPMQAAVLPAAQNEILRGMQFDVRVNTTAGAKFETTLTRDIQAEADLRLRGTPYKPVFIGRVSITQGEVLFFGNRYNISRGDILFLNPVRLEPVLNLDLETRVRGIDVTIGVNGPPHKPNVTYRSDPPLQPSEIIALLAVGRAPTADPALVGRRTEVGQDWGQLGASTVIGQALAAKVSGGLQRFFGVSRIKIDPRITGVDSSPQPQLILEQQISRDLTFTYITDLAENEQQTVRVEWNVNRNWSVQAVRQENGLFGVEFQYRKQFK